MLKMLHKNLHFAQLSKDFEVAVLNNNVELAKTTLLNATKKIDKAVTKGLLHKNAAARQKSRLTKKFNSLSVTA